MTGRPPGGTQPGGTQPGGTQPGGTEREDEVRLHRARSDRAGSDRARPRVIPDDDAGRREAIETLRAGGIVALPTDTVYGIAVWLTTPDGIERLFQAKRRPPDKAIALLLSGVDQVADLAFANATALRLADAFWPGPLTLVLPRRSDASLPAILTDGLPTVGVRVPDHACPRAIAAALGPLPTTSANLSGQPDSLEVEMVLDQLGDRVDLILDGGRMPGVLASTVVDCTGSDPRVLREGALGSSRIQAALRAAHGPGPDQPEPS